MKAEHETLLLDWEERRNRGEAVSLDMLYLADPDDQAELRHQAQLLEACDRLLGETCCEEDTSLELPVVPKTLGPYEVRGILGGGGMGVVYAGWDPILQRRVALKMLRPFAAWLPPGERERLSRRFNQEAQVLAKLHHAHIVPIYAATVESSACCIVMEQVAGGSLEQHRKAFAESGPQAVAAFMEKVARAVHHAHSHGILHRDLKPANILLDEAGEPRVSDFGLAKLFAAATIDAEADFPRAGVPCACAAPPDQLTLPDQEPGTPPYMAPEQFDPTFGPIRPTTDVWSLGVVLYELLTGTRPFQGKTRVELAASIRSDDPTPPRKHQPRLDRRLERIVLRCLAKDPQQRYPTAEALADALQRFQQSRRQLSRFLVTLSVLVLLGVLLIPLFRNWWVASSASSDSTTERTDAEYRARTDPLLDQLRRGEAVELIAKSDGNLAKAAYFPRDNSTRAVEDSAGMHVLGNGYANFLELLPSVPLSHYRITAKVCLERISAEDCLWGVYCRYDQEQSFRGLQRYYHAVTLAKGKGIVEVPAAGRKQSYYANLSIHLYADLLSPSLQVFRDEFWTQANVENYVSRHVPAESADQVWQTLILEVSPQTVQSSCIDSQGRFSLPPLSQETNVHYQKILRDRYDDLAAIPWFPRPDGSAVGIFLRASICAVSGFRVEPMAVANPSPK